jgi:hypothetical protein
MQDVSNDPLPDDEIRHAPDIARRALTLFATVGLAFGAPKDEILEWLRRESLWAELSPQELAFVHATPPSERQRIHASWCSERLLMLLWALMKVDDLPALNAQCDAGSFQSLLPPCAEISVDEFIASARRRNDAALLHMADSLLNAHWQARDARRRGLPMPPHLHIGVIQERHHAINWIIGYEGLPWDEVTTDT